ncbi:hypothetical protein [Sedimentibacter saalensis]|uniref:hypothetical protein n=1 Tax=Sedimentibacter saalensis TaxID=130788 RepID=UPI0028983405|nr:hypothetical protein [Sedimentibacter saalensis]
MENHRDEKKRALNIIWNASGDYSFTSEDGVYDEDGRAELYFNFIVGAVHKYHDYSKLLSFFNYLKSDIDHEFYRELTWIGLESSVFDKIKDERPVLENLRRDYARKVLESGRTAEKNILQEVKEAHYMRALGQEIKISGRLLEILNALEFDRDMDTGQIIDSMKQIIKLYFRFNAGTYETLSGKKEKRNVKAEATKEGTDEISSNFESAPAMDIAVDESAETSRDLSFQELDEKQKKIVFDIRTTSKTVNQDRQFIQKYFGSSTIPEHMTKKLENILCVGNHKKSNLHFTRGEFDQNAGNDADAEYFKRSALEQRETNMEYYRQDFARNYESISKLTNKIRNTLIAHFESSSSWSKSGNLAAQKIWRNVLLEDNKIFVKNFRNNPGNIAVDILLDSSASQVERQEIIAAQGYIIAESLTRCQIPVRVYSYSSLRNFTIINLYRDYVETDKNNKIFSYNTAGCNRDGLAIRTALHMMKSSDSEHKILIVLSDCKPNDIQTNPATGIIPARIEYSGATGVEDTAIEVKKGINEGVSVLCVFTGLDEDVPSAKKIYGRNFVRINTLDRFADIVGVLLQNQLKSL